MLQYEVVTFGLLPSVAFLWFLTKDSGSYIPSIFTVSLDPEDGTNIRYRNVG